MPIRYRRRGVKRPRNKMPRRRMRARIARPVNRQVHWFKRTCRLTDVTASISELGVQTNVATAYQFNLNQLPNVSEFTTLFDQYKITGAKITFSPVGNNALISPLSGVNSSFGFGRVLTAIDFDDSTTPAGENEMMQYQSCKITNPMKTHTRYLSPKVLAAIYQSSVSTSYESRKAPWIDVGNPSVPHYGLKLWINAPLSTVKASITYNVYLTLYFGCKNVR